mmetsp:Transcript_19323/g.54616  ORF Transcript_19323/g.54616 Transcript_19323/m.54616 type:complete len:282 (+) Transcript_19323:55-900(+)
MCHDGRSTAVLPCRPSHSFERSARTGWQLPRPVSPRGCRAPPAGLRQGGPCRHTDRCRVGRRRVAQWRPVRAAGVRRVARGGPQAGGRARLEQGGRGGPGGSCPGDPAPQPPRPRPRAPGRRPRGGAPGGLRPAPGRERTEGGRARASPMPGVRARRQGGLPPGDGERVRAVQLGAAAGSIAAERFAGEGGRARAIDHGSGTPHQADRSQGAGSGIPAATEGAAHLEADERAPAPPQLPRRSRLHDVRKRGCHGHVDRDRCDRPMKPERPEPCNGFRRLAI